jgi:hypothetical protein
MSNTISNTMIQEHYTSMIVKHPWEWLQTSISISLETLPLHVLIVSKTNGDNVMVDCHG